MRTAAELTDLGYQEVPEEDLVKDGDYICAWGPWYPARACVGHRVSSSMRAMRRKFMRNNYIQINITTEVERAGVKLLLHQAGYHWSVAGDLLTALTDSPGLPGYLLVGPVEKAVYQSEGHAKFISLSYPVTDVITAAEFSVDKLVSKPVPEPLMIGGHGVVLQGSGVQIGCTFVTREQVIEVAGMLGIGEAKWIDAREHPVEKNGGTYLVEFNDGDILCQIGCTSSWCGGRNPRRYIKLAS